MRWKVEILNETVSRELEALPLNVRASLVKIVERIEQIGLEHMREPHVKHVRHKLWEMRPSAGGIEGRAIYVTARGARVVIVAAFAKKTQKTPQRWLDLAEERSRTIR